MSPERLCRHEPCHCEPAPGSAYCDRRCEECDRPSHDPRDEHCPCGHPECRPGNARVPPPDA